MPLPDTDELHQILANSLCERPLDAHIHIVTVTNKLITLIEYLQRQEEDYIRLAQEEEEEKDEDEG